MTAPAASPGQDAPQAEGLSAEERERLGFDVQVGDGRWIHDEVERILADRLAAQTRDHEAESQRRLAEQRDGIAAAIEVLAIEHRHPAYWPMSHMRTYAARAARAYRGDS